MHPVSEQFFFIKFKIELSHFVSNDINNDFHLHFQIFDKLPAYKVNLNCARAVFYDNPYLQKHAKSELVFASSKIACVHSLFHLSQAAEFCYLQPGFNQIYFRV